MSNELTIYDREKLEYYLRTKMSLRAIAKVMVRDVSVISREIQRNSVGRKKYRAKIAQDKFNKRKHKSRKGKFETYPKLLEYVEKYLNEEWSPDQIANTLKEEAPLELDGVTISHESIYNWIYTKSKKHKKLYKHLRTKRNRRRKQGGRKKIKTTIRSRVSFRERSEIVDLRLRLGDWETDTVEFLKNKGYPYLSVQYERKSQLVRMHVLEDKSAEETKQAIIKTGETIPHNMFHTMTFDNGTEGATHYELKEVFPNLKTYFCDPYSPWQKGGVENVNRLIRQYLPRNINKKYITPEYVKLIENKLNNRPRKKLNYLSPNQFIKKVLHA